MERYEVKEAHRMKQQVLKATEGSTNIDSISKHFAMEDFEKPEIRDLTRMHASSYRMRKNLNEQQVEL